MSVYYAAAFLETNSFYITWEGFPSHGGSDTRDNATHIQLSFKLMVKRMRIDRTIAKLTVCPFQGSRNIAIAYNHEGFAVARNQYYLLIVVTSI